MKKPNMKKMLECISYIEGVIATNDIIKKPLKRSMEHYEYIVDGTLSPFIYIPNEKCLTLQTMSHDNYKRTISILNCMIKLRYIEIEPQNDNSNKFMIHLTEHGANYLIEHKNKLSERAWGLIMGFGGVFLGALVGTLSAWILTML